MWSNALQLVHDPQTFQAAVGQLGQCPWCTEPSRSRLLRIVAWSARLLSGLSSHDQAGKAAVTALTADNTDKGE